MHPDRHTQTHKLLKLTLTLTDTKKGKERHMHTGPETHKHKHMHADTRTHSYTILILMSPLSHIAAVLWLCVSACLCVCVCVCVCVRVCVCGPALLCVAHNLCKHIINPTQSHSSPASHVVIRKGKKKNTQNNVPNNINGELSHVKEIFPLLVMSESLVGRKAVQLGFPRALHFLFLVAACNLLLFTLKIATSGSKVQTGMSHNRSTTYFKCFL